LAPAPITRKDVMELVLIVVVILLIRYIVKFFVKATVGEHVANEFAWIMKPAIVCCCLPCSGRLITGTVLVEIVADCKTLPSKITIWGGINGFIHVISIGKRRRSIKWHQ